MKLGIVSVKLGIVSVKFGIVSVNLGIVSGMSGKEWEWPYSIWNVGIVLEVSQL